ncbi:uncharacterized protein N0V89_000001 [Didymosphaeria variabile]|uniref:Xylanolytic transcriptional activator regulatory domain-containing protein n=1 Tax=Didymosphaeria variabile TaxID=1932322 RepID=A0A9W9CEJ0_9PLEO|nr:uncharacterized protein N0V89_000001 [Didymosphaeria variabile]KAJ4359448.1 hypothetical protein N0V89_000001 [Didymosphaeria variabile]
MEAFLEQILLDEVGRIRPQFDIDEDEITNGHAGKAHEATVNRRMTEHRISTDGTMNERIHETTTTPKQPLEERVLNPRKRKLEEPLFATALLDFENVEIADHLPSQPSLVKIAEYFCTSFHHWIVPPTQDWTCLEERRRLFWVIFLLDRFCSVSTGWNTSLTSEDVHRRLPADGGYFTREEPVSTPFFGIWSKAAGRIGRSLANVPAQYNEEDPVTEPVQGSTPGSVVGLIDSSKLGAFAYCVEATESLSQVTTFFLQQRINWQDKEHAINWLTRFKELDLRLVQWKMFLPPRWKDSDISQNREVVNMDPNLTLAHITHNTSMILLHHSIAYPPKDWSDYIALPKDCSAQTCRHAAVETANIVTKFLTHTLIPFVNTQFAFCTFIAAKVLLYEHQATGRPLRPEFDRMKRNLEEMSARWIAGKPVSAQMDQAARYAHHLGYLHDACRRNGLFTFNFYDHSCRYPGVWTLATNTPAPASSPLITTKEHVWSAGRPSIASNGDYDTLTSPKTVTPPAQNVSSTDSASSFIRPGTQYSGAQPSVMPSHYPTAIPEGGYPNGEVLAGHSLQDQSLLSLSDTLMDSQFLDMDRVITFEDTNFYLPGDAYRWQTLS